MKRNGFGRVGLMFWLTLGALLLPLGVEAFGATIYWAEDNDGDWDVDATANFSTSRGVIKDTKFANGDDVNFEQYTQGHTVTVAGTGVDVSKMTVDGTYTFTGGPGADIKSFDVGSPVVLEVLSGTVVFNNNIDFTQGTTTNNNTLSIGVTTMDVTFNGTASFGGGGTFMGTRAKVTFADTFSFGGILNTGVDSGNEIVISSNKNTSNATEFGGKGTVTLDGGGAVYGMSANNDNFSGTFSVKEGLLNLLGNASLSKATVDIANTGSALVTLGTLAGNKTIIGNLVGDGRVDLGASENTLILLGTASGAKTSYDGALIGGGGLTIGSTGPTATVALKGTNTYTGHTTIANGVLKLIEGGTLSLSSGVTIADEAGNQLDISGAAGDQTIKSLNGDGEVILGDNTLIIANDNGKSPGSYNGNIKNGVSGNDGGLTLNANAPGDVFTLTAKNEYEGATTIAKGTLKLGDDEAIAASSGVKMTSAATTLEVADDVNASIKKLDNDSNAGSTINLGTGTLTLTGSNTVSAEDLGSYNGVIADTTGNLAINAAHEGSHFTLNSASDHTGATSINKGILRLGVPGSVANSSGVIIGTDGTFDIAATSGATVKALTSTGTGGKVNLGANKLTIAQAENGPAADAEYAGVIGGATDKGIEVTLNHNDSKLTLSGANTYTGDTIITKGTLALGATGSVANTKSVQIGENGIFDISATNATIKALSGAGRVNLGGKKLKIEADTAGDMAYAGVISGTTDQGIEVDLLNSTRKFTLSGANTYQGETLVTEGTLALKNSQAISQSSGLTLKANDANLVLEHDVSNAVINAAVKTLTAESGTSIALGDNTLTVKGDGTNNLGELAATSTLTGTGNLVIDAQSTADVFTVKNATGHTGETSVAKGILKLDNAGSISNSSKVTVGTDGRLDITSVATSATVKQLSGDGDVDVSGKELVLGKTANFAGVIGGIGGQVTVDRVDGVAGDVAFTGEQSYTGLTTIRDGALTLRHDDAVADSSGILFDHANAKLQLRHTDPGDAAIEAKVESINEASGIAGAIDLGDNTLAVQQGGNFSGVISGTDGNVALKATGGSKELTLSGANTYTGSTTVENGGKLTLAGGGSIEDSSGVTLNNATLAVNRASGTESKIKALGGSALSDVALAAGNTLTLKGVTASGAGASMGEFNGDLGTANTAGNLKLDAVNKADSFTLGKSARYTGTTDIASGVMKLKDGVNLNSSSEVVLRANGALDLSAQGGTDHNLTAKLTSAGSSSLILGTNTLTLSNADTNFVGTINSGNATLGKLTLTGGTTAGTGAKAQIAGSNRIGDISIVNGGVLKIEAGSSLITTQIGVGSAGTLEAGGTINGNIVIASGGLFKSSNNTGSNHYLTVNGSFAANTGSQVELSLAAKPGAGIKVTDTVNINGAINLTGIGSSGIYTLFKTDSNTLDTTGAALTASGYNARLQTIDNGKTLQVVLVQGGQYLQTWNGGAGAKWDNTGTHWLDPINNPPTSEAWMDLTGNVAVFNKDNVQKTIEVVGTRQFDTIQFAANGYVLNDGVLQFNTYNGSTATIGVDGVTATVNSKLTDGAGSNTELAVNGGGTLVLTNTANDYTGGTSVGGYTTLQLNNGINAAGTGDIALDTVDGNATLALNFSESNFNREIADNGGGSKGGTNAVKIMDGNNITFTAAQDYSAATVIGKGSSLTAGTGGDLSAKSAHYLDQNASLILADGDETIGGLAGEAGSTLALGGNTLTVNQGEDNAFLGSLTGSASAAFVKNGTAKLSLDNIDTSVYGGTFASNAGILALYGKTGSNMDLRLAAGNGTIMASTSSNSQDITLSGTHNGKLEIERGNLVLDAGSATTLAGGSLALSQGVSMDVGTNATVGGLALNGNTITFGENGSGGLATLTATGGFTAAGTSNLYVDSSKLGGSTGGDFFTLANTGSGSYLINGANSASSSNFAVRDLNGKSLEGTITDGIVQGGTTVGTAVFEGGVSVDSQGVFYGRKLTEIHSTSSSGLVIDSTPGANAGVGARANGQKDMSAKLSGDSFTFEGTQNILVSNPNNNYIGSTVVNMATNNTTVTAGVDNAFGSTRLLDIQRGGVNVNNKTMNVGALSGAAGTTLNLGTGGGTLNIKSAGARTDESTYAGRVTGSGNIVKSGNGSQLFTNNNNNLVGNITLNGGSLAWNGNLNGNRSTTGNVAVNSGDFIQAGSAVAGNVTVGGSNSSISGWGNIGGNLTVNNGGTYKISVDSGRVDQTSVGGKTTFGQGSSIIFNNEALNYMYLNPSANLNIITSGNGFDFSKSSWKDGVIRINMGILGTARLEASGSSLNYTELEGPTGSTGGIIAGVWSRKGVRVGDVLGHSGLGNAILGTFTRFNTDDAWKVDIDPVVNARFANVKFMGLGPDLLGDLKYSRADVLSVFNHESGLSATQPVDAAMDTTRTMIGQGVMNRVNSLRAARTILSNTAQMPQNPGAAGSGLAYGSLVAGEGGYINADGSVTPDTAVAAATYAPVYNPGYGFDYRNSSLRVWAGGIGHWSKYDTSPGGIGGYKYNSGGVMVGMDGSVGEYTFGGAFGYTRGTLKDRLALSSSSDIDTYSLSLYSDYNHASGVNTMFFGGVELFDNDISRRVAGYRDNNGTIVADHGKESSDYRGYGWYLGTNLSYDFLPTDNLTVTPSIGLTYADVRSKAFTRRTVRDSGTVLTDRVSAVKKHSVSMPIDVAVTYDAMVKQDEKVSILGNAGYAYEFHNQGAKGDLIWSDVDGTGAIRFTGRDPGRSAWNFGIGARYQRRNVDFDVKYDYTTRKDLTTHRISAAVGFEF